MWRYRALPDTADRKGAAVIDRKLAEHHFGSRVEFDAELGTLTTYRVGGTAAAAVHPRGTHDLEEISEFLKATQCPILIVGRGSNLLIADAGFEGLAVFTDALSEVLEVVDATVSAPELRVSANTLLPVLARRSAALGFCGLEWAVGVPGTVGGAVRMNAGGHGSDIAASLVRVSLFDIIAGTLSQVDSHELELRFRGSRLRPTELIIDAIFSVTACNPSEASQTIDEIVHWRREHQPGGQNAGSVFVNPRPGELSAGELIDSLGLRGHRIGSAEVSAKHANFIQADPQGSANDVVKLMAYVRKEVQDRAGIELRSEIRLVGFSADMTSAAGGAV